jgi:hypothetical protein
MIPKSCLFEKKGDAGGGVLAKKKTSSCLRRDNYAKDKRAPS